MDDNSKYIFYGSATLAKVRGNCQFCEELQDVETGKKMYIPVDVGEVHVTVGEDENKNPLYHLIAKCWSETSGNYTLDFIITKKEYLDFINNRKRIKSRLNIFLKYSKEALSVRKITKDKDLDIRMKLDLYNQLAKDAEDCKMAISAYARMLLDGKRPRKALNDEEYAIMQDFVAVYRNYENFFNAAQGTLKGMTPAQKLNYIIEGRAYSWWRKFLMEGLPIMQRMIDGQRMYSNNSWKDAEGKQLPKYDRDVIALVTHGTEYKVVFAHRPNPKGYDGKSIIDGTVTHHTPKIYGKGGWNQPDVKYWLDVVIPKQSEKEE